MAEKADIVDFLIQFAIFATFVVFGVAVWLVKRESQEKAGKKPQDTDEPPQSGPGQ